MTGCVPCARARARLPRPIRQAAERLELRMAARKAARRAQKAAGRR